VSGWIGVASAAHVARGVEGGFSAFSHGSRAAAARPRRGDRLAYYAPRETPDGPPLQAFVALGTIADDAPEERNLGSFRPWVRRTKFEPVTPAPVRPLLDRLSFVTDKRGWGMAFRRGLFRVPPEDFAVVEAALRHG
jgi:EVE domain